jgi:thiol-disulfide isomerase/thioredoxin
LASQQDGGPFVVLTYFLDGKPAKRRAGDIVMNTQTKWEGAALLVNTLVSGATQDYTIMERWKRSRDGGTLTIHRTIAWRGAERESVLVYEKPGSTAQVTPAQPTLTTPASQLGVPTVAVDTRERAPRFSGRTLDGERFTNETLKGKVVLLQFWATSCGYCRRDQNMVDSVAQDLAGEGLVVLAVNVGESKRKVKQYLEDFPRSCKIALTEDTNLAAVFAARSFPFYVVIDREGRIAATQRGSSSGGERALYALLNKAGL